MPSAASRGCTTTLTVWEGEWPLLKRYVKYSRVQLRWWMTFVVDVFDAKGYASLARDTAVKGDKLFVDGSKLVSKTLRENPWIAPASCFGVLGLSIFSKSLRWGVFAATRNSLVGTTVALCLVYPHELRRLALDIVPV